MVATSIAIEAPIEVVWAEISDLGSHDRWMKDAESIAFESPTIRGTGTRLRVATRIGPLRTVDLLEVVEWVEGVRIGVAHTGAVTGRGSFELEPVGVGTRLTWKEELRFPWWMGGSVTAWLAAPVLSFVWRRNLSRLKRRIETDGYSPTA